MNPKIKQLLRQEKKRQNETISLIASENYASLEILRATGSVLTNKYAEGYPGKRYYAGCSIVDAIEECARTLGKNLFSMDHCNVQPHSGSQANMAVYATVLNQGDTVLGMGIASGGHLTHGYARNFSGTLYNFIPYGVNKETELLAYDELALLAHIHRPKLIVLGASSYSRTLDFQKVGRLAKECNALLMADIAHIAGLVITNLHPSPSDSADFITSTTHKTLRGPRGGLVLCTQHYAELLDRTIMPGLQGGPFMHSIAAKAVALSQALTPTFRRYQEQVVTNARVMATALQEHGFRIVSGGTDTHLFVVDLKSYDQRLTGKIIEEVLEQCRIIVNRNVIPFDTETPLRTSGIRIGTPAMTTRGCKEDEVRQIAAWIAEIIQQRGNQKFLQSVRNEVLRFCKKLNPVRWHFSEENDMVKSQ